MAQVDVGTRPTEEWSVDRGEETAPLTSAVWCEPVY